MKPRRKLDFCSMFILVSLAGLIFVHSGAAENTPVTFTKDVAAIFYKNCAQCHRPGEAAPFSVLTYKDARPWAKSIREKVLNGAMPPWHADLHVGEWANDRRLIQKEIDTIIAWVDQGAKEGEAKDLPPQPRFTDGWNIGQPDLVLQMPEEYTLEASGPDEYQYFTIPTNFTEDRYIRSVEARPGNRKIVHHILAMIQPPPALQPQQTKPGKPDKEDVEKLRAEMEKASIMYSEGFLRRVKADAPVHNDGCALPNGGGGSLRDASRRDNLWDMLTVWAPGRDFNSWEPGVVKKIPAGSQIILQVHYSKAVGSVQKDRSSVGLIFAKEPPAKLHITELIYNAYMQIPPGAERHRSTACWTAPVDIQVKAFMPHMHMRGSAMEVKAVYPDGRVVTLLNVPQYDFSWQTNFAMKQPLAAPKGTRFLVTGYFDNSAKNRFNPDPAKAVRWGDPTYDEMLACFIDYTQAVDNSSSAAMPDAEKAPRK